MHVFKSAEAVLVVVLLLGGFTWVKCEDDEGTEIEPYKDDDLIDHTCGTTMNQPCCPNLKNKFDTEVEVSNDYKGGPDTCKCRCSDVAFAGENSLIKKGESGGKEHYFCKAGYGQAPASGADSGDEDGSESRSSIMQQCKLLVFAVLVAAAAIL